MSSQQFKLIRKQDQVIMVFEDGSEKAVKIVYPRPISGRDQEVSFIDDKRKEILMIDNVQVLDADSKKIAEEELEKRYCIAQILRVTKTQSYLGNRYWDVETDKGDRRFAIKNPNKDIIKVSSQQMMLRDTLGNRYEIKNFSQLDMHSQAEINNVV